MSVTKQLYEALLSAKQLLGKLPPDGIPELETMAAEDTVGEIEEALEAYARDDHRPQYIGDLKELDG